MKRWLLIFCALGYALLLAARPQDAAGAVAEALDLTVSWVDRQAVVSDGETDLLTISPDIAEDICVMENGTLYLDASTLARSLNLFLAA